MTATKAIDQAPLESLLDVRATHADELRAVAGRVATLSAVALDASVAAVHDTRRLRALRDVTAGLARVLEVVRVLDLGTRDVERAIRSRMGDAVLPAATPFEDVAACRERVLDVVLSRAATRLPFRVAVLIDGDRLPDAAWSPLDAAVAEAACLTSMVHDATLATEAFLGAVEEALR